jgi:hypothetical protein
MAKRYVVQRSDSGAGVSFKSKKEADEFVRNNPAYAAVDGDEPETEAKAVEPVEDKAVKAPSRKAQG